MGLNKKKNQFQVSASGPIKGKTKSNGHKMRATKSILHTSCPQWLVNHMRWIWIKEWKRVRVYDKMFLNELDYQIKTNLIGWQKPLGAFPLAYGKRLKWLGFEKHKQDFLLLQWVKNGNITESCPSDHLRWRSMAILSIYSANLFVLLSLFQIQPWFWLISKHNHLFSRRTHKP